MAHHVLSAGFLMAICRRQFLYYSVLILSSLSMAMSAHAQTCNLGGAVISCLEVRNDLGTPRTDELAFSGLAIPAATNLLSTDLLEVTDLAGTSRPAQFRALARWNGPLNDAALPIRWLEVVIQDAVAAQTTNQYQLRLAGSPPAPLANPLTVTDLVNSRYRIDSGAAVFTIDGSNPALLEQVVVGAQTLFTDSAGAGPRLVIGGVVLDSATAGTVLLDPGSFTVLESGPLKARFSLRGHFVGAGGATLCNDYPTIPDYQAMGFTVVFRFLRSTGYLDIEFELRNECLDLPVGTTHF